MPITFHHVPESKLIICAHTGRVGDDEFLNDYKSVVESELFTNAASLLIDLSQADSSPRSSDMLMQFADFMKSRLAGAGTYPKVAVVAPNNLSFGLARMYELLADSTSWEFVIFRAIDTALAWLRAPMDLMDELDNKAQRVIPRDKKA